MAKLTNARLAIAAAVCASVIFVVFVALGKEGDCAPQQIDGQCGLSTFLGVLYGGGVVLAITLITGVTIAVRMLRAQRQLSQERQQ